MGELEQPGVLDRARAEIARCVASRKIETGAWAKDFRPVPGATAWDFNTRRAAPEAVNALLAEHAPPVYDPFCGGGSIPLEAQRLGLRAYASDLNPVPVLITKAFIEIPSRFAGQPPVNPKSLRQQTKHPDWSGAKGLAEDVRYYGKWMRDEAEKRIGHLYPKVRITSEMNKDRPDLTEYVGQELTVIAWLWARTVASPNPAFRGVHIPLVSSFWLGKKSTKMAWIEPEVDRAAKTYRFHVRSGEPSAEQKKAIEAGTKLARGCKFRCLLSDEPIPESYVKSEGVSARLGARLMAIVAEGRGSRLYLDPIDEQQTLATSTKVGSEALCGVDSPIALDKRAIWCLLYGLDRFDKLFTGRQLVALTTFSDLVQEARKRVLEEAKDSDLPRDSRSLANQGSGSAAYADAVTTYLAFAQSKACNRNTTLCMWETRMDRLVATFGRQGLPMVWDYAETNPFAGAGGDIFGTVESVCEVLDKWADGPEGAVVQLDARIAMAFNDTPMISTDPPYYDNIGYADLSDFFYVWLRRCLGQVYPQLFATVLTPKSQELIASPYRHEGNKAKAQDFFEHGLAQAFRQINSTNSPELPLSIFYAFKQSETDEQASDNRQEAAVASTGWETMLEAVQQAGFLIDGTWPIRTEQPKGLRAYNQNALASSIVLVCRPRPANAPLATRKEFMNALRQELPDALRHLQHGNIAPVDLAQASIGPGMAVFSRYARVIEADGRPMTVRTALQLINQALDEVLAEQEGEFDSDTRWAIAWFDQYGVDEGPFGTAETLSKAKNTSVVGLSQEGILSARGGKVRLLRRDELPEDWDPATDTRRTVWEVTQHLIRALETKGEGEPPRCCAWRASRAKPPATWPTGSTPPASGRSGAGGAGVQQSRHRLAADRAPGHEHRPGPGTAGRAVRVRVRR